MAKYPDLGPNSPLTEALIDIRVQLPPEKTIEDLEKLYDKIKADYPHKRERRILQFSHEVKKGSPVSMGQRDLGVDGLLLKSKDEKEIVQFRLDGFTFNRLYPYESWEKMRVQAKKYWDMFVIQLNPIKVNRIAVRSINNLKIPLKGMDLKKFFRSYPKLLGKFPTSTVENFLFKTQLSFPDIGAEALITQSLKKSQEDKVHSVLLDIDIFKKVDSAPEDDNIWKLLDNNMRDLKNKIFYGIITSKTLRFLKDKPRKK